MLGSMAEPAGSAAFKPSVVLYFNPKFFGTIIGAKKGLRNIALRMEWFPGTRGLEGGIQNLTVIT